MAMIINGVATDQLPASDRGLQYGDGLFETIAVAAGRPQLWQAHMARMQEGCDRLGIPFPGDELLLSEAEGLCKGIERGVLKIIITRGSGGRGYRPPETALPTRILSLHPWPDYPVENVKQGVWIRSCHTTLGIQPRLAGLKHLNRLEQVLARGEWNDPAIVEGVMCDPYGMVIEGTMSNLFFVRGDRVVTPALGGCGVAGVMRRQVLDACRALSIETLEQDITVEAAKASEGIFLTNSLIGVWPVRRWDDTKYLVPGETTATIISYMNEQFAL
jgi:4-amino-4-deoxychorismate lyase